MENFKLKRFAVIVFVILMMSFELVAQNSQIAISPTKMNVLYIGVDNPLEIAVFNISVNKLKVTINHGTIINKANNQFIARVLKVGSAKIIIYNGNTLIGERLFRVERIPDPRAVIGNNPQNDRGGLITKSELLFRE